MIPFINIHTHHFPKEDGVFLFNNRFGFDKDIFTGMYFSAGIHPWDADLKINWDDFESLIKNRNCLAIGECGLDKLKGPSLEIQTVALIKQLEIAVKYKKPVIIHCVKAFDELINICKDYRSEIFLMIHGFNKSEKMAEQLIHAGFMLSLNPLVFDKDNFGAVDLTKIFLETDTRSDLSIEKVYSNAARFFNKDLDKFKEIIYRNFTNIFLTNGR